MSFFPPVVLTCIKCPGFCGAPVVTSSLIVVLHLCLALCAFFNYVVMLPLKLKRQCPGLGLLFFARCLSQPHPVLSVGMDGMHGAITLHAHGTLTHFGKAESMM